MTGRSGPSADVTPTDGGPDDGHALSRTAMVSRLVTGEGASANLVYREQEGDSQFSGFWVWSGEEPDGWGDDPANFARVRLATLIAHDPTLEPLFWQPPRSAFFRESADLPFEREESFPFADE